MDRHSEPSIQGFTDQPTHPRFHRYNGRSELGRRIVFWSIQPNQTVDKIEMWLRGRHQDHPNLVVAFRVQTNHNADLR